MVEAGVGEEKVNECGSLGTAGLLRVSKEGSQALPHAEVGDLLRMYVCLRKCYWGFGLWCSCPCHLPAAGFWCAWIWLWTSALADGRHQAWWHHVQVLRAVVQNLFEWFLAISLWDRDSEKLNFFFRHRVDHARIKSKTVGWQILFFKLVGLL